MFSEIKRFCRNKYVLFIIASVIIIFICVAAKKHLFFELHEQKYISVECCVGYEFSTNDPKKINDIIDFINDGKPFRPLNRVDTLASPEIMMILTEKDGTQKMIEIYSGAFEEGLYLVYNNTQYKIRNSYKFCENAEAFFRE